MKDPRFPPKETRIRLIPIGQRGQVDVLTQLPPEAQKACTQMAKLYTTVGFKPPWIGYLAYENDECVGTCAFKTAPKANRVEIAYNTFPKFEKRGFATRMAQELLGIVKGNQPGLLVTAQTLPGKNPSASILKKLGFEYHGAVDHPKDGKVWEWWLTT